MRLYEQCFGSRLTAEENKEQRKLKQDEQRRRFMPHCSIVCRSDATNSCRVWESKTKSGTKTRDSFSDVSTPPTLLSNL